MDYDALAKKYGGTDVAPVIDYDALAKKYGGADIAPPKQQASNGILGSIRGAIETGAGLVSNIVTAPIVEGAKIYGALTSGKFGTPEGIRAGEEFGNQFQRQNFYQPRTEEGQRYLQNIGEAASKTGMQGVPLPMLADLSRGVSTATRAAPLSTAVKMPFDKQIQAKRERLSAESYAKAPQLDAIAEAQRLKLALNPVDIENSISARAYSAAAGPRGPEALAKINQPRVTEIAKNELGIDSTTSLTSTAPYKQARANLAAPYEQVKKLPIQQADDAMIQRLEDIRTDLNVIGANEYAPAISKIVDDAIAKTQTGLTGEALIKNISVLRERARKTYNNKSATTEALDIADTNLKIATELESMIDNSIFNPKLLGEYRDARQKMARTYAYEGATDFNTGKVDVSKLARITAKDNALTGDIASLGKIAGNFPEAFTTQVASKLISIPRLTRSGLGGATGALIGSPFGMTGSLIGMGVGSVLGEFGGGLAAKRMASPGYQAGLTMQDYRIPINQLAASAAPIPQNRAVVPFDPRNAVVQPGEDPYFPNFQMQGQGRPATNIVWDPATKTYRADFPPEVMPSPPNVPNNLLGMSAEPAGGGQMNALRMEDARRAALSRIQGQQAEAQQAAAEAAARRPAGGEVILDIDPITGRMREASQGVKGATPETFRNLSSLDEAAKKVTAGKLFDLTAAEKVAWEKATVDIKDLGTGYNKLDDKAIAKKMMDREWVAQAYSKAREKALMFDEIAKRAANEQTKFDANVKRDQMLDLLSTLEDNLRNARPDLSGKQQGPKTREAFRNKLAGGETKNALSEEPFKVEIRGFNRE